MPRSLVASGHEGPVLFYDGTCGLCNRIVRLLLRLDRRGALRFAPLQGPTAQHYLRHHGLPLTDFDSLIFVPNWSARDRREFRQRTDGAIAALRAVGGVGTILAWSRLLPPAWRDALYTLVARCRYRFFGEWKPCPLPRPEWKARFLE
jgi:predicted DCC family thiol-disulfide oxidoreductase YuxK